MIQHVVFADVLAHPLGERTARQFLQPIGQINLVIAGGTLQKADPRQHGRRAGNRQQAQHVHRDDRERENRLHVAAQRNQFQHNGNRQPPRAVHAGKGQHARQIQAARVHLRQNQRQTGRQQQRRQQERVRIRLPARVDQRKGDQQR